MFLYRQKLLRHPQNGMGVNSYKKLGFIPSSYGSATEVDIELHLRCLRWQSEMPRNPMNIHLHNVIEF